MNITPQKYHEASSEMRAILLKMDYNYRSKTGQHFTQNELAEFLESLNILDRLVGGNRFNTAFDEVNYEV